MNQDDGWRVTEDNDSSFIAELFDEGAVWKDAYCRWDGCVTYTRYFNHSKGTHPDGESDALHICSLADTIADLLTLWEMGVERFAEWKGGGAIADVLRKHGWEKKTQA